MKRKDPHIDGQKPIEQGSKPKLPSDGSLIEGPMNSDKRVIPADDAKLFELAREVMQSGGIINVESLNDLDPGLYAEICRRNISGLLTNSMHIASFDQDEVERHAKEILKRQSIQSTDEEIKRLVSLVPELYTVPDFQHVKAKAKDSGITLTDEEVTKMCWVLRGFMQCVNEKLPKQD